MHSQTNLDKKYITALNLTDGSNFKLPNIGSLEEKKLLEPLEELYTNYSIKNLSEKMGKIYAEKIYFRDAFKQFDSTKDLISYMIKGLGAVEEAGFKFNHITRSSCDFFIEWSMHIKFKANTPYEKSIGMSRFRFDSEGKVIFHQDYWDPTTLIYSKIPIAKQLIRFVQKRL